MRAGLAGRADDVDQPQALRMTLNGLGNGISVECDDDRGRSRRIFQSALPSQVVAFVHGPAQRNAGLLQRAYIAGDAHQNQSLSGEVA